MRHSSYLTPLLVVVLLTGVDSSASLVLPDAEFSFSAPTLDAKESAKVIEDVVTPLGFHITRQARAREDGFFRAEFERPPDTSVYLMGRPSCVHVGIYAPKASEAVAGDATDVYAELVKSLRKEPDLLLFRSAGGRGSCEEAL